LSAVAQQVEDGGQALMVGQAGFAAFGAALRFGDELLGEVPERGWYLLLTVETVIWVADFGFFEHTK
jgi:hypothetical protein